MAINRLMLRCEDCGEDVVIARLTVGDEVWSPSRTKVEEYAAWLEAHTGCLRPGGVLRVKLVSENDVQIEVRFLGSFDVTPDPAPSHEPIPAVFKPLV